MNETITIYRVEGPCGEGPFRSHHQVCNDLCDLMDYRCHPTPADDFENTMQWGIPNHMLFGCPSMDMLAHWFSFPEILEELELLGYHIYVYCATPEYAIIGHSGTQVMFDSCEAVFVERLPLNLIKERNDG